MTKRTKHIRDFFEYAVYIFALYLLTYYTTNHWDQLSLMCPWNRQIMYPPGWA